jgi:hypothetical protein
MVWALRLVEPVPNEVRPVCAGTRDVAQLAPHPAHVRGAIPAVLTHKCGNEHRIASVAQCAPLAVPCQTLGCVADSGVGCCGAAAAGVLPLGQEVVLQVLPGGSCRCEVE